MSSSDHQTPERLLSAALRAQAVGGATPGGGEPAPQFRPSNPPSRASRPPRLPVVRVLLAVLVLGLLAGALAGYLSLL